MYVLDYIISFKIYAFMWIQVNVINIVKIPTMKKSEFQNWSANEWVN